MKGAGKKRFGCSLTPEQKQVRKRTTLSTVSEDVETEATLKRNLLNVLNEAAGIKEEGAGAGEGIQNGAQPEPTMTSAHTPKLQMKGGEDCGSKIRNSEEGIGILGTKMQPPERNSPPAGQEQMTVDGSGRILQREGLEVQVTPAEVLAGSSFESQIRNDSLVGKERQVTNKSNLELGGSTKNIPVVSCMDNDIHLDLATSQPLVSNLPIELNSQLIITEDVDINHGKELEFADEFERNFPPLNQGSTKLLAARFEGLTQANKMWKQTHHGAGASQQPLETEEGERRGAQLHGPAIGTPKNQWPQEKQGTNGPTAASKVKNGDTTRKPNEPFVLQPDKIMKIGSVGTSEGRPSLYFSGEDTNFLSAKMGHAIVGKFSHSIPSSNQVQKLLDNARFTRGFRWNYINAKHIIVQFEEIEDYAKMLNGPNGSPVWFIDHHAMRVFKWTPTFDPFFETPIAAVWCNVIGVPIHLFEVSANRRRLSFARICVEIDISKPPTEEIVLDILGRELVLKVKWDRIPLYCRDCKHVGHGSRNCHTFGKGEGQQGRFTKYPSYGRQNEYRARKMNYSEGDVNESAPATTKVRGEEKELRMQKAQEKATDPITGREGSLDNSARPSSSTFADYLGEEAFFKQGRRGRKGKQGVTVERNIIRTNSADQVNPMVRKSDTVRTGERIYSATTDNVKQRNSARDNLSGSKVGTLKQFEQSNPFQQLQHEDYGEEEDGVDLVMEEDPGDQRGELSQAKPGGNWQEQPSCIQ